MSDPREILRLSNGHFSAILQLTTRGHVWWAAPSIKQLERRPRKEVISYAEHKGWRVERYDSGRWIEEVRLSERFAQST